MRNAHDVQNVLLSLIEQIVETPPDCECEVDADIQEELFDCKVRSFERAGLMTNDAGLLLVVAGREFQITITER